MKRSLGASWTRLLFSIAICEAAAAVGSVFTISAIPTWYASLRKPWFTPPNWLFAPVWLSLYFLMGVSLFLLWGKWTTGKAALTAFGVQLFLNVLWAAVFFGGRELFYGLVVVVALWGSIAVAIALSYQVSRAASLLLTPYIVWVTIASLLNYFVWVLNV